MLISGISLGEDFLATFFDVTERRQAEDEVRRLNADLEQRVAERTAELTAANRELDSFAYAVSHDLRAPLRAMSGFSQALTEDYGSLLQGDAQVFLDQINLASRKMSELIDGLLVLSRSTRGELQYDEVDLSALADHVLAELKRLEPTRLVAVQVEAGLSVRGDMRMLELVLRNLLDNAWKYSAHASAPSDSRLPRTTQRTSVFLRCRQRRRLRHGARQSPVSTVPAPAPAGRIPRYRHRPGHRATHHSSPRRPY
jgi:signal transduction histidine kinase